MGDLAQIHPSCIDASFSLTWADLARWDRITEESGDSASAILHHAAREGRELGSAPDGQCRLSHCECASCFSEASSASSILCLSGIDRRRIHSQSPGTEARLPTSKVE